MATEDGSGNAWGLRINSSAELEVFYGALGSETTKTASSTLSTSTAYLVTVLSDDTNITIRLNGADDLAATAGLWWGDTASRTNWTAGAVDNAGTPEQFFEGKIATVQWYEEDDDVATIESALNTTYNVY